MNKSILFFLAGTVSGILATSLFNSSSSHNNITGNDTQFEKISNAIDELNTTTSKLQNLVQKYTHVLPAVTTGSKPQTQNSYTSTNYDENTGATNDSGLAPITHSMNDTMAMPATPPTPAQIEQYNLIETELYNSANNSDISLTRLIQQADSLTREQRNALTQRAMDMIKRGELNADQFGGKPNS